jgi:hypothetical protein
MKREIKCYCCDQIEHMAKDCKVKIRVVNNLEEREETNKTTSQYFRPKEVRGGESVNKFLCINHTKKLRSGDSQHVNHGFVVVCKENQESHTLQRDNNLCKNKIYLVIVIIKINFLVITIKQNKFLFCYNNVIVQF